MWTRAAAGTAEPERAIDARRRTATAKVASVEKAVKLLGHTGVPVTRAAVSMPAGVSRSFTYENDQARAVTPPCRRPDVLVVPSLRISLPRSSVGPMMGDVAVTPTPTSPSVATRIGRVIVDNVETVVLGKHDEIVLVVAGMLAGGHVLVEDVPGVGKTVLAKSLAGSIGGTAGRVQGTADLMPADVTGVNVFDPASRQWDFHPGPVFSNVLLFDEINRATPRAQSALLEAMAERQVTVDGASHPLPRPFFVIATQNPHGEVGTFPLVEGQCDRFALVVSLGLPGRDAERSVMRGEGGTGALEQLQPVVDESDLLAAMAAVEATHLSPPVGEYVLDIVAATRSHPQWDHGASPRAARILLQVAKAHATLAERDFVAPDDVKAVAGPVLAHRLGAVSRRQPEVTRRLLDDLVATIPAPAA